MVAEVIKGFSSLECEREQKIALELFGLMKEKKLTPLAESSFRLKYDVYFNTGSGNVFLCDEDYNVLMERDGELDLFISTSYEGREGFFDELMDEFEDLHIEDKKQLRDLATDELKEGYKEKFDLLKKEEMLENLK